MELDHLKKHLDGDSGDGTSTSEKSVDGPNGLESSTPQRQRSRGRRRSRRSGRSSICSPSPIRPRLDSAADDPGGGSLGIGVIAGGSLEGVGSCGENFSSSEKKNNLGTGGLIPETESKGGSDKEGLVSCTGANSSEEPNKSDSSSC